MVDLRLEIPDNYLEIETRDGYTISSEMKKVWAVELDLLNEFTLVCKKYGIKFFAAGGTLLGAVRHKGFIPWDDDIDLMMVRSEYNRLCEIAPKEFKYPYFFQTETTDPGSFRGHAQLRNSNTTGILKVEYNQRRNINQGIFIDIFPLDLVPDDPIERGKLFDRIKLYDSKCYEQLSILYPYQFKLRKNIFALCTELFRHFFTSKSKAFELASYYYKEKERLIQSTADSHHLLMTPLILERFVYEESLFLNSTNLPFELLTIPVPENYVSVLDSTYGNWREFIKGGSVHGGVIFDTDIPYTEYFKEK